jgi:serine/threonine-protein kinase
MHEDKLGKLGRYDLLRVVGKGAMGVVYEARDPHLERRVAIKTISVDALSEQQALEYEARFRTEARSAARLQHPNIVSVYDADRDLDVAFLVMEYVEGRDLKHHLDQGARYTLEQIAALMGDLLAALDYAHSQRIIHRDIKPANLLIENSGRLKLTDFGVARIQDAEDATRTRGAMIGTLKYMAPEQVQGLPVDARCDLFSAGIVLYQLLTGARPFEGGNDFETIQQIVTQTPPPPSSLNPSLPPEIDRVLARALEKDRERRYASAAEFNDALQQAVRCACDPTVAAPASRRHSADGGSAAPTQAGSGASASSVPASTVTQEVELVYWKEIRDSSDPQEFQAYLQRFPDGIYADLARRRLQRLSTGSGSQPAAAAAPPPSPDAPTQRLAAAAPPAAPRPDMRRPIWLGLGALATAALAGLAIGLTWHQDADDHDGRQTLDARPAVEGQRSGRALGAPGQPAQASARPAARGPTLAAPTSRSPATPPTSSTGTATAAATTAQPAAAPAAAGATISPAASDKAAMAPTPQPTQATQPPDPRRECEGRILLGYETCMKDQCDKPKFAPHPICVERRRMEERNMLTGS